MRNSISRRLGIESLETRTVLAASITLPDTISAGPGEQFTAPVTITDAVGTRAAQIQLAYNTNALSITEADITAGSIWGSGAQVVANVNATNGTLTVFVFASEPFTGSSGTLLNLRFTVRSTATVGSTSALDLQSAGLNEGQVVLAPAPQVGSDASDSQITVTPAGQSGSGEVTGFVFADANQNTTRETAEGIAGVTIELVNSAGTVVSATTDSQGSFRFANVAAGSYTVRQVQPNAYIDGGTNSLTVTVANNQSLSNQNFREIGLKAAYLYNRFLTTPLQPVGSTAWTDFIAEVHNAAQTTGSASTLLASATTRLSALSTNSNVNADETSADDSNSNGEGETTAEGEGADSSPSFTNFASMNSSDNSMSRSILVAAPSVTVSKEEESNEADIVSPEVLASEYSAEVVDGDSQSGIDRVVTDAGSPAADEASDSQSQDVAVDVAIEQLIDEVI